MSKKPRYAEGTSVAPEKSQMEIKVLLSKYGCQGFAFAETATLSRVEFMAHARRVRFALPMPSPDEKRFMKMRLRGYGYDAERTRQAWEAEVRRLWRCLLLSIKSKLEVVETGMAIFEEEFLANIVLPDGRTAGEHALPAIARAYETGQVAGLLGPGSAA